jgi:hypothetical protein
MTMNFDVVGRPNSLVEVPRAPASISKPTKPTNRFPKATAQPTRPYRIFKPSEASDIISRVLEPIDDLPCPRSCRGGTSRCSSTCATDRQPRQYTDSLTAVGMRLQITVRRVLGRTARRTVGCPPIYADAFGFPAPPGSRRVARHHDLLPIAKHSVRTQPRRQG